jgi:hypothetical protein
LLIIRASLRDLKPQISCVLDFIDQEFAKVGCETTVLTSAWREFGEGSLHPYGYAADFDSAQMPENINDAKWTSLKIAVKDRLGKEYDVLAHGPRAHLHVEYDPRRKVGRGVSV